MRLLLLVLGLAPLNACIKEPLSGGGVQCTPTPFTTELSPTGDTVSTSTGLRFINSAAGYGNAVPWCRAVAVNYTGRLLNGTKFDSSFDTGRALVFTPGLGALIDGFEQGVIGMQSCASRRVIIPPELAYGANEVKNSAGQVIVPANSTLVYDIDLLLINGEPQIDCQNLPAP